MKHTLLTTQCEVHFRTGATGWTQAHTACNAGRITLQHWGATIQQANTRIRGIDPLRLAHNLLAFVEAGFTGCLETTDIHYLLQSSCVLDVL
jgi:hypothetical protein